MIEGEQGAGREFNSCVLLHRHKDRRLSINIPILMFINSAQPTAVSNRVTQPPSTMHRPKRPLQSPDLPFPKRSHTLSQSHHLSKFSLNFDLALSDEVVLTIFSYLSPYDLCNVQCEWAAQSFALLGRYSFPPISRQPLLGAALNRQSGAHHALPVSCQLNSLDLPALESFVSLQVPITTSSGL